MDTYLACGSEAVSSVSEECRDYVKILHALISGEWAAETTDEDEQVSKHVSIVLLMSCMMCCAFKIRPI